MKKKTIAILAAGLAAALFLAWGIVSFVQCRSINNQMDRVLSRDVDENTEEYVQRLDEGIAKVSFWGKLFIPKLDNYEELRKANDAYVTAFAAELTAGIAALEPCTSIATEEEYHALSSQISTMRLDTDTVFGQRVKELVPNYEELLEYEQAFLDLVETYRYECTICSGSGRVKCSYCNGKGSQVVTWYEFGDWGEKSYSSTDCTYCSSGKKDCTVCGGDGSSYMFYDKTGEAPVIPGEEAETVQYNMEDLLDNYFRFVEDPLRHDYLKEIKDKLQPLSQEELEALLGEQLWLYEANTYDTSVSDLILYTVTRTGDGTYHMECVGEWSPEQQKIVHSIHTGFQKDIEVKDGYLLPGGGEYELREAEPGYYFYWKKNAATPTWIYILCDEEGTPLYPRDLSEEGEGEPTVSEHQAQVGA